jgi:hypothetical protein
MYDGAMSRYCTKLVIICHGSNYGRVSHQHRVPRTRRGRTKSSEDTRYRPSVAASEMTTLRKMGCVKIESAFSGPVAASRFSTLLNARKNAANCAGGQRRPACAGGRARRTVMYTVMTAKPMIAPV